MPTYQIERIAGKDEGAAALLWESLKTTVFREKTQSKVFNLNNVFKKLAIALNKIL